MGSALMTSVFPAPRGLRQHRVEQRGYFPHIVIGREWSPFSGRWLIGQSRTVQSEKGPNDAEPYIGNDREELE